MASHARERSFLPRSITPAGGVLSAEFGTALDRGCLGAQKGRGCARGATSCGSCSAPGESKKAWAAVFSAVRAFAPDAFLDRLPKIDRDDRRVQERRKYRRFTRLCGLLDEGSDSAPGSVSTVSRAVWGREVARLPIFPAQSNRRPLARKRWGDLWGHVACADASHEQRLLACG